MKPFLNIIFTTLMFVSFNSMADTVRAGNVVVDNDSVSMPGISIDGDSVSVFGVSIGADGVSMPGVSIDDDSVSVGDIYIDDDNVEAPGVLINNDSVSVFSKARMNNVIITSSNIISELGRGAGSRVDLTVNFKTDSADVFGEAHAQVYEIAEALNSVALHGTDIIIEGHTDADGDGEHNIDLSYRRALSVKKALVKDYGIEADTIRTKGLGEQEPIASNETQVGKSLNRRVTIINDGLPGFGCVKGSVICDDTMAHDRPCCISVNK